MEFNPIDEALTMLTSMQVSELLTACPESLREELIELLLRLAEHIVYQE